MPGWIKISIDETCHVVWRVNTDSQGMQYLHAIGDGADGNRVTDEMAEKRFHAGTCKPPWLPVLFPERAVTQGQRSRNCITAATRALWRGWFYGG